MLNLTVIETSIVNTTHRFNMCIFCTKYNSRLTISKICNTLHAQNYCSMHISKQLFFTLVARGVPADVCVVILFRYCALWRWVRRQHVPVSVALRKPFLATLTRRVFYCTNCVDCLQQLTPADGGPYFPSRIPRRRIGQHVHILSTCEHSREFAICYVLCN